MHSDIERGFIRVEVTTYSSHYETDAASLATYSEWYKEQEQPDATDAEFLAADMFELVLVDFYERFGRPSAR